MSSLLRSWSESPEARPARIAFAAAALSLLLVSTIEALWPLELIRHKPSLVPALIAHMATFVLDDGRGAVAYLVAVVGAEAFFGLRARERPRLRALVHVILAGALLVHAYLTLLRHEPFAKHPILAAPYVAAFVAFSALGIGLTVERVRGWRIDRVCAIVGLGGFAFLHGVNHSVLDDAYSTFHLSLLIVSVPLLFFGIAYAIRDTRSAMIRAGTAIAVAVVLLGPVFAKTSAAYALPDALLHTMLGKVQVVFTPFTEDREGPLLPPQVDPDGVARFLATSGMPALPPSFSLDDYNVLFVTSEAVRFDATSLADPSRGHTPNLRRLVDDGAFSFVAAHSPSSATVTSNAAMMAMTYPSATRIDVGSRSWAGALQDDEVTVAEWMKQAGYATFRVTHDYHLAFSANILGFDQGFDQNDLMLEAVDEDGLTLDQRIADAAVARIQEHRDRRFFGWVYFGGPHAPYTAHYAGAPAATEADRYFQELQKMDEQLGVVLDALRAADLFDETIVVFVADHGEELGDRGSFGHKTLYSECTQVPFVVRVPGVAGRQIDTTTSTLYTFPWLFLHGKGGLRAAAEARVENDFGPMMRAIGGAVVVELIGSDKMWTALVTPDKRVVYSFVADGATAYDLTRDPGQRRDLFITEPDTAQELLAPVRAYREVRRGIRRYRLNADAAGGRAHVEHARVGE